MKKIILIIMATFMLITGCSSRKHSNPEPVKDDTPAQTETTPAENTKVEEPEPVYEETPVKEPDPEPAAPVTTIRPEIKEAIDAYEAYVDEYIAFMKKYETSDDALSMLMEYSSFVSKLDEYQRKMDALESTLNDAEYIYFLEVVNRCNTKLLESM